MLSSSLKCNQADSYNYLATISTLLLQRGDNSLLRQASNDMETQHTGNVGPQRCLVDSHHQDLPC